MPDVSLDAFSDEVTAFLDANAKRKEAEDKPFVWGEGEDDIGLFEEIDREREQRALAEAQDWRAKRYDAGLGWITGPTEYGGRELTSAHDRVYAGLEAKYDIPAQSFFGIGLGMVAPTILAHAQPQTRDRYLAKMYRGDIVGCQLFSEPGAGSDLASLQTRAERDGEEWILNGQKVWTSGAQYSDIGEIICRTDPDKPKHKGLTGFVVDMHAPGVEVRPLRQMTGGASFNEVFFTDVRVPDDHRLGDVNEGWTVALTTLDERACVDRRGQRRRRLGHRQQWTAHRDAAPLRPRPGPGLPPGADAAARRLLGREVQQPARDGQDQVRPAAGPGDVDRQAVAHAEHVEHRAVRVTGPRRADDRRHRRVGHVLVVASSCSASRACASPVAPTR